MDATVSQFYTKGGDTYEQLYRLDHSPRIRAILDRYNLVNELKGKRVVDVGGGQGFLGEMLDESTDYWVVDGADIPPEKRLCKGCWVNTDLDHKYFGVEPMFATMNSSEPNEGRWINGAQYSELSRLFDTAFFLETIEHIQSPYHAVVQLKEIVKPNGDIFISTPTETVTHNTPYPSLFWPPGNFAQWLGQLALPILDFYVYEPKERGWPAYQYRCRNADWTEAVHLYPKQEPKFRGKKPHEMANL